MSSHNPAENKFSQSRISNSTKNYNPGTVTSTKLMEQQEKRKLLWSHKTENPGMKSHWEATSILASRGDQGCAEKFRKLMGINKSGADSSSSTVQLDEQQKRIFQDLEKEYEKSRVHTHTQRGTGLGFSSKPVDFSAYHNFKNAHSSP
ncbi:arginine serine-rich coiled-coil 2 [Cichlidogyrus casuarinus]|uniref:Arginine serine-rich coiled-coil 2 n=1 Tax=Cichlidogyrus casuarinus TaxID=1844966 RepID=A0ABD2QID2_9PLAT